MIFSEALIADLSALLIGIEMRLCCGLGTHRVDRKPVKIVVVSALTSSIVMHSN